MQGLKWVTHDIWHNVLLFYRYTLSSFRVMTEYKLTFILSLAGMIASLALQFIFWSIIIGTKQNFMGWTLPELILLSAVAFMFWDLWSFLMHGVTFMSDMIIEGQIDTLLTRPINTFLAIVFNGIDAFHLLRLMVMDIPIFILIFVYFGIPFNMERGLIFLIILVLSVILLGLIISVLFLSTFWIGRNLFINPLLFAFGAYGEKPLNLFPLWARGIFTFVYPIIFVAVIPVRIIFGRMSLLEIGYYAGILIILLVFWAFVLAFVWKMGLKRYESGMG